jgi:hypothetical protein
MRCDTLVTASQSVKLSPPVPDLIDPRHGQPGRLGQLLAGDTAPEALADQAAQLGADRLGMCRAVAQAASPPASRRPQRFGDSRLGESVPGRLASRDLWPDAERFLTMPQSVVWTISIFGGVDDQQVGLGPVGDVGWDRSQQPPDDAAVESGIADDQQVRVDLLGQIH